MNLNDRIIIGPLSAPLFTFTADDLLSVSGATAVDLVGDELSVDQLTPTIFYPARMVAEVFAPKGYDGIYTADGFLFAHILTQPDIRKVPYGTPVYYLRGDLLVGKYYVRSIERTAKSFYKLDAVSPIGLLDRLQHLGGVYNGQTFDVVLNDIIGGVVPFSVSTDVAALEIYNWLPIASRRENLHQLLFAYGVAIKKDANGDMVFGFLSGDAKTVPENRIYNTGSINYSTPATGVDVTEHSFQALSGVAPVTLFDNTDALAVTDAFIPLDPAPVFDLQATGNLTIKSSGPNWAIVNGSGVLTGKPYTHLTRTVSVQAENTDDRTENIVRVSNITLVNRANSYNVARRLLSYYSSARTVTAELSLEGEHSGDQLAFTDPFGEAASGFLERMELSVSSNLKARCTIITDYTPKPETALFNRVDLLTAASGVYTVPDGVTLLRVAIGQAGADGQPGTDGGEAEDMVLSTYSYDDTKGTWYVAEYPAKLGGEGGQPGAAGEGGKILVVDIPVTPGQQIAFAVGQGSGAHSTFGENTSATGTSSPAGWQEPLSGTVYGRPGVAGLPGGNGGGRASDGSQVDAQSVTKGGTIYAAGASYGQTRHDWDISAGSRTVQAAQLGSYGGGAAVGSAGKPGKSADAYTDTPSKVYGISGGAGADALPNPDATVFCQGGDGGNGGGGAGSGGTYGALSRLSSVANYLLPLRTKASGGKGSRGSKGAPGAIWVYWTDPITAQAG